MSHPTAAGVRSKISRAAKSAGLYLDLSHSNKSGTVKVDTWYPNSVRRDGDKLAGLAHFSELNFNGTLSDWLRANLSHEELLSVVVNVLVSNSEISVDYFSEAHHRVLPDWDSFLLLGATRGRWSQRLLGVSTDDDGGRYYDRGSSAFVTCEVSSLAPSPAAMRALALLHHAQHVAPFRSPLEASSIDAAAVSRVELLSPVAQDLLISMADGWEGTLDDLVSAVEALVPAEPALVELAPVLVEPAQVEPVRDEPAALVEYLGRLLHAPKREYAVRVWVAVRDGVPVPEHAAEWAADVVRKVRRYANA